MAYENEATGASWAAQVALDAALQPVQYTEREWQVRALFAQEYLYDYSSYNAAIRCGFHAGFAMEYGQRFLQEPAVQHEIRRLEMLERQQEKENPEAVKAARFAEVQRALRRDMHSYESSGSHAARVNATGKLMALYQLDKPTEQAAQTVVNVMVVPGIASVDDWEATAIDSQAKLLEQAAEDANRVD